MSGGYYDAGDTVKFGFPLSSSLTVLAWGGLQYEEGYKAAGSLADLEGTVRWVDQSGGWGCTIMC